ncbi:pyridoxal phosphate-dependent aminotransferase [Aestuariibius insulae]|uniref:pyridoxal phosphate-dependent aminotransferase n=1 Tax=Aestuariibius insulae TaxID=2058287 RepID=UPI00345E3D40
MRNSRRSCVDGFIVMDVMETARAAEAEGRHIVHMEIGQPGTGAPAGARAALAEALEAGPLGYTVGLGQPELRARIAQLYAEWYGVSLDPGRVVVTAGASGAFILAFSALFDNGARVGLGTPCYPSYRQILTAMGLDPVSLPTGLETRYQPVPDQVTEDLDGLIVASPANPTGTMLDREAMAALIEACTARGVSLISDEIYHGLHHDERAVSALELTDEIYVINSFSKYFSMTGWRIGWMVVPEDHVRVVERLAQNLFICAPHASQVAALAALECREELEGHKDVYARNRSVLLAALQGIGLTRFAPPDGGFYIYADVSDWTTDSLALSEEILREAGVAVTPGLDFDPDRGGSFLRLSYAGPEAEIAVGAERLAAFFKARRPD